MSPRVAPKNVAIMRKLLGAGVDARIIAKAVGLPIEKVLALHPGKGLMEVTEDDLSTDARALAQEVLTRARYLLQYGAPSQQVALIRSVLLPLMKQSKPEGESDEEIQRLQAEFKELVSDVRAAADPAALEDQDEAGLG